MYYNWLEVLFMTECGFVFGAFFGYLLTRIYGANTEKEKK